MSGGIVARTSIGHANEHGFTLTELMVVVLIIGILVSVAFATFIQSSNSAAGAACKSNQRILENAYSQAVASAKTDEDIPVPDELQDLAPYVANIEQAILCPLDESPLEFDAATGDVSCPNHP